MANQNKRKKTHSSTKRSRRKQNEAKKTQQRKPPAHKTKEANEKERGKEIEKENYLRLFAIQLVVVERCTGDQLTHHIRLGRLVVSLFCV